MNALGIMFDLTGPHFRQQIIDIFVIGQRHLDAHAVQTLHRGLAHAAADEELTVGEILELGHVCGIAAHAMSVLMIMVMMMVMLMIARIGKLAQFLPGDLAIIEGDNEKRSGLAEVPGDGFAVVCRDSYFDAHNDGG